MKKNVFFVFILLLPFFHTLAPANENLIRDLMIVEEIDRRLSIKLPVTYNNLLTGGMINMPSARMGCEGEISVGYSDVHPYRNLNLRMQLTNRLELSGNYRVFKGVKDPILSSSGFGDFSDKGANVKFAIVHPEDSDFCLPGVAVGFDDFIGTRAFRSNYIVATQVLLNYNLEMSLGYGDHRIREWFGGVNWSPFYSCGPSLLRDLTLTAEYDAIPYYDSSVEPHPKGRTKKSPINFGIKYRLLGQFDFSGSYIRGDKFSFSASTFYNFGYTKGFITKYNDPLPYKSPCNTQPLGYLRPEEALVQDLIYPLRRYGFDLLEVRLANTTQCGKILRINIVNLNYRQEHHVREHLTCILANLLPSNIDTVIAVIEAEGFPLQQYRFRGEFLRAFAKNKMCAYEVDILSPLQEVTCFDICYTQLLYKKNREWFNFELVPKTYTFFGSATGKFKYTLGLAALFNGYICNSIFYYTKIGWTFYTNIGRTGSVDRLNPSQIINVRTDSLLYVKEKGITVDQAYLQRNWNLGCGWFSKLSGGLFEPMYGGVAGELLYYPVKWCCALGIEGAVVKKRNINGIGFTDKIRKLKGFIKTYRNFTGSQYFLDLYYDWHDTKLDFKIQAGKFLANDYGARFEISRYFPSGMRITVWYTRTDAKDYVNGHRYYDKGIAITMPLDIFYTYTSRNVWGYGMSAWLRDIGATSATGQDLYNLIRWQRQCNR